MLRRITKVLVLCSGNSSRSIMAEALINHLGAGRYQAASAGSRPTGSVHPGAVTALTRHGIPCPEPRSKSWDEFEGQALDLVITVCDQAAREACPAFAGKCERLHWSTPDPVAAPGCPEAVEAAFEQALEILKKRIELELL